MSRIEIEDVETYYDEDDYQDKVAHIVIRCKINPEGKSHASVGVMLDEIMLALIKAGQK